MTVVIGVDPGLRGGMARLEGNAVEVVAIPIIPAKTRKGRDGKVRKVGRDQYDLPAICEQLRRWTEIGYEPRPLLALNASTHRSDVCVFVEQSVPLPPNLKAGSLAQFQRGVSRGWSWMLTALGLPHELVHPRTWMAEMHRGLPGGDTKARSVLAAKRLFPRVNLKRTPRSKKDDDGFAEALLIAEYGRRRSSL